MERCSIRAFNLVTTNTPRLSPVHCSYLRDILLASISCGNAQLSVFHHITTVPELCHVYLDSQMRCTLRAARVDAKRSDTPSPSGVIVDVENVKPGVYLCWLASGRSSRPQNFT